MAAVVKEYGSAVLAAVGLLGIRARLFVRVV